MILRSLNRRAVQTAALVDDTCLRGRRTGIGHYLAAIARHWPTDAQIGLIGLHTPELVRAERGANQSFPNVDSLAPVPLRPLCAIEPTRRWIDKLPLIDQAKYFWRNYKSSRADSIVRSGRCGLLFEPNNLAPQCRGPILATMQDLSVIELPDTHPADRVRLWNAEIQNALQRTTHWITLSQATADSLCRYASIPKSSISVIPAASRWPQCPPTWSNLAIRKALRVPERFLLYLGTIEPRKNLTRLLDAYALMPPSWRRKTPLILAGLPGWGPDTFWEQLRTHAMAADVQFTGYLTDPQAAALLSAATALVYPSLYEGFGLPLVEAMRMGTPIVASDTPSLKEVAGDAAVFVDPSDTDGWRIAIAGISEPGEHTRRLAQLGHRRASEFCWSKAATAHHNLFRQFLL